MRDIITLQCGDCKNRNYTTTKNKKKHTERMEKQKFCNACRKHTAHKEVKKTCSKIQGSRFNRRPSVSKTESGGSNPSSPARFMAAETGRWCQWWKV